MIEWSHSAGREISQLGELCGVQTFGTIDDIAVMTRAQAALNEANERLATLMLEAAQADDDEADDEAEAEAEARYFRQCEESREGPSMAEEDLGRGIFDDD